MSGFSVCIKCGRKKFIKDDHGHYVCKNCGCGELAWVEREKVEKKLSKKDLLRQSYFFYGKDQQRLKCVEELNELATALIHYRDGKASAVDVAEEVADVEIMCAKMHFMLGEETCKEAKQKKLARLAEMFEEDKKVAEAFPKVFKPVESDGVGE